MVSAVVYYRRRRRFWHATLRLLSAIAPLTSTWPHLRCDVGLEEGVYRENCLCLAVLCTIIMEKIRAVLTGRSTVSGFDLA